MTAIDKKVAWLHGKIKSPPFSKKARIEAGFLIRRLQEGEKLSLPQSRPMPSIGVRWHELRITDEDKIWRIVYRIDSDLILIAEVFSKKTSKTPKEVIQNCKNRLKKFDDMFNT
jgi:phage-related protein